MNIARHIKSLLIRLLEKRGYCLSFGEPATFAGILSAFNSRTSDFFFVQVGAYDGRESDPLHNFVRQYQWHGILVEPQADAFEKLKRNYADCPSLIFENAAIAEREDSLPLFKLKDAYSHLFHADHRTLTSFSAEHILKHLSEPMSAEQALETLEIPCLSLSALFQKHAVTTLDLLQIDAEGYDYQIIKTIDFGKVKPRVIRFEHANLAAAERENCIQLLLSQGYKLVMGAYDITAFQSRWIYD